MDIPPGKRVLLLEKNHTAIPLKRQCFLLGIGRSTAYYETVHVRDDAEILSVMDEIFTACPFYGKRKMKAELNRRGFAIGIKKVRRLMRKLGLSCVYPKPKTSIANPAHKKYPYLLRGLNITKPNQVWGTDITFIRLFKGWAYLVAIIDWHSRYVLSWKLSITMEKEFCIEALQNAMQQALPEIFNSDQGSQFTSDEFTRILEKENVKISMDGRGRCLDNIFTERLWRSVKYEEVYLKSYATMKEAREGLERYFHFYNHERLHQSLNYKTPAQVHFNS